MKKNIFFLLIFIVSACASQPQVTDSSSSNVENTVAPTQIPTLIPMPTEIPLESLPIEEIAQKYIAGEIDDISFLSNEQRALLSVALAEIKNEQAGTNFVSFIYLKGEKYYLNPDTLSMEKMPANPTDEFLKENSFKIYLPVDFDAQGNVMYFYNSEWRTVPNSVGFDFGIRITDPNDTRIDWPKTPPITEGEFAGMTPLQKLLVDKTYGLDSTLIPVVPIKDGLGEIIFEVGPAFRDIPILKILTFEANSQEKPIMAKISLLMPSGAFLLYEEGEETMITSTSRIREYGEFWETLQDGELYYLTVANNPQATIDYTSHISTNNVQGISLGNIESQDVSVVVGSSFIKNKVD